MGWENVAFNNLMRWKKEIIIFICNICNYIWLNLISHKTFIYLNCQLHMTLLKFSLWCYVSCRVKYNECQIRGTTPSLGCYFQCNIYFCIRSMFVSYIFLSLSCKYIVHHCDDCKFCLLCFHPLICSQRDSKLDECFLHI